MLAGFLHVVTRKPARVDRLRVESCRDCAEYLTRRLVPHHRPTLAADVARVWPPVLHRLRVVQNPGHFPGAFSTLPCSTCCTDKPGDRFLVEVTRR